MRGVKMRGMMFLLMFLLGIVSSLAAAEEKTGDWQFAGWYGGGMYPALTPDPNVEGRLYLGSDVAGIWRSDDRGDHWFSINQGLLNLNTACIAVAPSDSNIVYAGTAAGVMRSENAGMNWTLRGDNDLKFKKPMSQKAIAVSPTHADVVYAGSDTGEIFATDNGGRKWRKIGNVKDLYGEASNITFVFVSPDETYLIAGSKLGVMKYSFAEKSWKKLDPAGAGAFYIDGGMDRKTGALAVTSGKRVYWTRDGGGTWQASVEIGRDEIFRTDAVVSSSGEIKILIGWHNGWNGGPFLSSDNGKTWANIGTKITSALNLDPTRSWFGGFQRANVVAIDPFNPDIFYYTDSWGVWRSDDNGQSWHEIINGAPNATGEDIAAADDGTLLVAMMDGGLVKSSDGGASYQSVLPIRGARVTEASGHFWRVLPLSGTTYVGAASPWTRKQNEVFTGDFKTGEYEHRNQGLPARISYQNTFWGIGYPRALAKHPKKSQLVYLGMDGDEANGFFYSEDGGLSWTRPQEQPRYLKIYNGLDTDPETGRIFWAACGGRGGIYTAEQPGGKWKERFFGSPCFFDLKAGPNGVVYAGGASAKGPVIYISRDHGENWDLLRTFDKGQALEAIALDPQNPKVVFAGLVSWGGKTINSILFSPDEGKSWRDLSDGLPGNAGPAAMVINPKDRMLYVLLYAGGVYKRPLEESIYKRNFPKL